MPICATNLACLRQRHRPFRWKSCTSRIAAFSWQRHLRIFREQGQAHARSDRAQPGAPPLTCLSLSFNLLNGKSTVGSAWGEVRDVILAEGQSVVVPVAVSDDSDSDASSGDAASGDTSSDTSPGGAFAGSRLEWESLSLTDTHGSERLAAIAASYETSNPDPVLDAFQLS